MYKSIIILISLGCIIFGKPKMGDDGYYYHSPYLTDELRKNTSSLIDFESVNLTTEMTLDAVYSSKKRVSKKYLNSS